MTIYLREFCNSFRINSTSCCETKLPVEVPEKNNSMTGYYQPFSRTFCCKKPGIDQHRLSSSYQTLPDPDSEAIKEISNLGKPSTYFAPKRLKRSLSTIAPHVLPLDYNSDNFTITCFQVTNADHRSITFFNWQTFENVTLPLIRKQPKPQFITFIDPSLAKMRPLASSNKSEESSDEMPSSQFDESEFDATATESLGILSSSLSDSSECGETLSASESEQFSDDEGYDSENSLIAKSSFSIRIQRSYSY